MIKVLRTGVHLHNAQENFVNFEPIYGSSTLIVADEGVGTAGNAGDERISGGGVDGEAGAVDGGDRMAGTAKSGAPGLKILVDPGHIAVGAELNELLKKEGVLPGQIDYVFITHHHLDHSSNMGAFPNAKIFIGDGYAVHDRPSYLVFRDPDLEKLNQPGARKKYIFLEDLPENFKILPTPGHTLESNSYLYEENGVRYICAGDAVREDVIRKNAPTVMNNPEQYLKSLKKIFELADVIIPGHGRVIEGEVKKELAELVEKM